jgi:hypothetical protein
VASVSEATLLLIQLGLEMRYCNQRTALVLLRGANLTTTSNWNDSTNSVRFSPSQVIGYASEHFEIHYAENTREDIRKRSVNPMVERAILVKNPDNPNLATNSPNTHYALTAEALNVVRLWNPLEPGNQQFVDAVTQFNQNSESLSQQYTRIRDEHRVNVTLPSGEQIRLTPGSHNVLQREIIEDYTQNLHNPIIMYVGDTDNRELILLTGMLSEYGVEIRRDTLLPDVIILDQNPDSGTCIHLVEAYHSTGDFDDLRVTQMEELFGNCTVPIYMVTALATWSEVRSIIPNMAHGTRIWVSERQNEILVLSRDNGNLGPVNFGN